MNVDSPGDDIDLLGPELKVVDPLEDDVPARDLRVRQLVVQQRVRRRDHRGALDAPHQRVLKGRKRIAHLCGLANQIAYSLIRQRSRKSVGQHLLNLFVIPGLTPMAHGFWYVVW